MRKRGHRWEERHYQMAEKSDKMFKDNAQGEEIDI